jgi:peptidoglycan/xylan/chitin deacetylase (PgdA/CDA1 family)
MPDAVMLASRNGSPPVLSTVRQAIKRSLFAVGYYHQRLSTSEFPGVAMLCYHGIRTSDDSTGFTDLHVTKATFERHCRLIADACDPISVAEFRDARQSGGALPPRSVIVTFDDGYRGVLDHALPILEQYGIPAAVFVSAGPVLSGQHFWFDVLARREGEAAVATARALPYPQWRALVDSIQTTAADTESHRPLTSAELKRLAKSPLVEIGAHTMTHPTLALTPIEDQQREIAGCRTALERVLERPVTAFAYPFGNPFSDYTSQTVSVVRHAGFDLAFTTGISFATLDCDLLQIPRFMMLDTVSDVELAHRLVHSWHAGVS